MPCIDGEPIPADRPRVWSTPAGVRLCAEADLADPGARGFVLQIGDKWFHGFVVRKGGAVAGWVDRCPHQGFPMALELDRYLTPDHAPVAVPDRCGIPAARIKALAAEIAAGTIPGAGVQVLYVLGRYTPGQVSAPSMIMPFLHAAASAGLRPDWAVCAFGQQETACLRQAIDLGGKARVGFENTLRIADRSLAPGKAARVREIAGYCVDLGSKRADFAKPDPGGS
jgi:hypothetical protein